MTIDDINLGISLNGEEETKKRLCEIINDFDKEICILHKQITSLQAKLLTINVVNNAAGYKKSLLVPTTLMRIHPELTYDEAASLMEFAKSKTITHDECYGDGSIIYPMWKEANYR